MKIELNQHFKADECVLYCGSAVYATLQAREEPVKLEGYVRTWKLRTLRRGTNIHYYVKVHRGVVSLVKGCGSATVFHAYSEASEIAQKIMATGTMLETEIIEILKFEYEEDYAP